MRAALLGLLLLVPAAAQAQPIDHFRLARDAYDGVDFEGTVRHAQSALDSGRMEPDQLAILYRLLGLSLSALGRRPEARQAFVRLLAVDPDPPLQPNDMPPQQRSTYMEARGFWAQYEGRLGAEHVFGQGQLRIEITDPASVVQRVRVYFRSSPEDGFNSLEADAARRVDLALAGTEQRAEIYYELTDNRGNILLREGSDLAPLRVGRWEVAATVQPLVVPPPDTSLNTAGGAILGVVAAGTLAGAIIAHVLREENARRYNGQGQDGVSACANFDTAPGDTRDSVCAQELSAVNTLTALAVTFYVVAGVAAVLSVVVFATAPSAPAAPEDEAVALRPTLPSMELRCGADGPGLFGLGCGLSF